MISAAFAQTLAHRCEIVTQALNSFTDESIIERVRRPNDYMPDDDRQRLADLLRDKRVRLNLSMREVAARAGVDKSTITLLESQKIAKPGVDTLREIATVLDIPMMDIYTAVSWLQPDELPSLRPYMRAKFADLPDDAIAEVEREVSRIAREHGAAGPVNNEDEIPDDEELNERREV